MAFFSFLAEAKNPTCAIYKFQRDTGNKKVFCIDFTLQELINHIAATESINPSLLNISKKKIRAVASALPYFYNSSWLINTDKFLKAIARFEELMTNS